MSELKILHSCHLGWFWAFPSSIIAVRWVPIKPGISGCNEWQRACRIMERDESGRLAVFVWHVIGSKSYKQDETSSRQHSFTFYLQECNGVFIIWLTSMRLFFVMSFALAEAFRDIWFGWFCHSIFSYLIMAYFRCLSKEGFKRTLSCSVIYKLHMR